MALVPYTLRIIRDLLPVMAKQKMRTKLKVFAGAAAATGLAGVTFGFMSPYWGYSLAALGISGLIFMAAIFWSAL